MRAVNSEGAPVVATAWEQVTANECLDASSTSLLSHKQVINSFMIPCDAVEAAERHVEAMNAAIRSYDERAEGKNAATERELLQVSAIYHTVRMFMKKKNSACLYVWKL